MLNSLALGILRQFLVKGSITITGPDGRKSSFAGTQEGPKAEIVVRDSRTLWRLVRRPDLEFGEAYMDGRLEPGKGGLDALLDLLLLNSNHWPKIWAGRMTLAFGNALASFRHVNRRNASKINVSHHYDLNDELFDSFLDPWRQYSCGYFHGSGDTIATAQINKISRIAGKLDLKAGQRVLDIGCGWGGLAIALAHCRKDIKVTGITLSEQQLAYARRAADANGLSKRVEFKLRDYRDQKGMFDRIVSIGMLEHVGPKNFTTYFDKVANLLTPDGVALIHSIGVHRTAGPTNRWVTKYIFPGGYLPCLEEMIKATDSRGFKMIDLEIMRTHYAETLLCWRRSFMRKAEAMRKMHDDRFVRMWEFYLAGCEYFFRSQNGMVMQMLLSHDHNSVPISRGYIGEREKEFRAQLCKKSLSGKKKA